MNGEAVLRLTFDEYRAVGAALISAGDSIVAEMLIGLDGCELESGQNAADVANELLGLITSVVSKLTDARSLAWGDAEPVATN